MTPDEILAAIDALGGHLRSELVFSEVRKGWKAMEGHKVSAEAHMISLSILCAGACIVEALENLRAALVPRGREG